MGKILLSHPPPPLHKPQHLTKKCAVCLPGALLAWRKVEDFPSKVEVEQSRQSRARQIKLILLELGGFLKEIVGEVRAPISLQDSHIFVLLKLQPDGSHRGAPSVSYLKHTVPMERPRGFSPQGHALVGKLEYLKGQVISHLEQYAKVIWKTGW